MFLSGSVGLFVSRIIKKQNIFVVVTVVIVVIVVAIATRSHISSLLAWSLKSHIIPSNGSILLCHVPMIDKVTQ